MLNFLKKNQIKYFEENKNNAAILFKLQQSEIDVINENIEITAREKEKKRLKK
jgi:hypothetical protein